MRKRALTLLVCIVVLWSSHSFAAEETEKPMPVRLAVDLIDGSRIVGTSSIKSIPLHAQWGAKVEVFVNKLARLKFREDRETAELTLQNGDKLTGVMELDSVELETLFGKVSIPLRHAVGIERRPYIPLEDFPARPKFTGLSGVTCGNTGAYFDDVKISSPEGQVLFQDQFDQRSLDRWWLGFAHKPNHLPPNPCVQGNWRVEKGQLVQDEVGDHYIALVEGAALGDQIIEARTKARAPAGYCGITLWYRDVNNWVEVYIYPGMRKIWVLPNIDGSAYRGANLEQVGHDYAFDAATNIWYEVKVEADGDTGELTVYVDGEKIFTHVVSPTEEPKQPPKVKQLRIYGPSTFEDTGWE